MTTQLRTPMNHHRLLRDPRAPGQQIEPKHLGFLMHIHTSGRHLPASSTTSSTLEDRGREDEIYPSPSPVRSSKGLLRSCAGCTPAPHLVIEVAPGLPEIETDLLSFKQVLFNLLRMPSSSPQGSPITVGPHPAAAPYRVRAR
jgi:hypothetical protein